MTRRRYMSPTRAAKKLGVHRNTAYGWARDSASGRPSRFSGVTRHALTGRLSIPADEVERLKDEGDDGEMD